MFCSIDIRTIPTGLLEHYLKNNQNGIDFETKIDFLDCKFVIKYDKGSYLAKLCSDFFVYDLSPVEGDFKSISEIISFIEVLKNDYVLDLEVNELVTKSSVRQKIDSRRASNNGDYEECYVCFEDLAVKTLCGHNICSQCCYKSFTKDGTFKCGICRQISIFEPLREAYIKKNIKKFFV